MFLKGKKHGSRDTRTGASSAAPAGTPLGGTSAQSSAAPAKRQPSGVPSIVSADLRIEGNLHSVGDVQIDGVVHGDISSKTLTVGEGAEVHGAIEVESLRICGTVEGEVSAKTVVLTKTARVYGDVLHETLSVEAGALIHGFCKRLDAPQRRSSLPPPQQVSNGLDEPAARSLGSGLGEGTQAAAAPSPAE